MIIDFYKCFLKMLVVSKYNVKSENTIEAFFSCTCNLNPISLEVFDAACLGVGWVGGG